MDALSRLERHSSNGGRRWRAKETTLPMTQSVWQPVRRWRSAIIIGLVNGSSWLRKLPAKLPPLAIDAALALVLGSVGATQLARGHGPFGDEGRRPPPGSAFGGPGRG